MSSLLRMLNQRGAAVTGVACAVAVLFGTGCGTTSPPPPARACNGHAALCQRGLDEVALAATHNSMSVPQDGWYAVLQDAPIAEQLRDGIRGLLIDTHYADRLPDGSLRTVLTGRGPTAGADGVSRQAVAVARKRRERHRNAGRGERGLYLCHSFCELGSTPLAEALGELREFLVRNPGEVVVVVNEDYVEPRDFVAAVTKAGLGKLAYRGPTEGRWATLREMIDDDERVVFLAEHRAGAAPWYHPAFERITQETPYSFTRPARLTDPDGLPATCSENRGPPTAPLFLVNHWITTDPVPRRADAEKVNAYEPLLARLRTCERLRGHIPNLVAVNFYRRGDLERAVDTLNGVD